MLIVILSVLPPITRDFGGQLNWLTKDLPVSPDHVWATDRHCLSVPMAGPPILSSCQLVALEDVTGSSGLSNLLVPFFTYRGAALDRSAARCRRDCLGMTFYIFVRIFCTFPSMVTSASWHSLSFSPSWAMTEFSSAEVINLEWYFPVGCIPKF